MSTRGNAVTMAIIGLAAVLSSSAQSVPHSQVTVHTNIKVTNVRTLADGNTLTTANQTEFWKASDGSTRLQTGDDVTIANRTTQQMYHLNLRTQTATSSSLVISHPVAKIHTGSTPAVSTLTPARQSRTLLAPINVEGFVAEGEEQSNVTPARSPIGNSEPLVQKVQIWRSSALHMPLKSVVIDPLSGVTTSSYTNVRAGESLDPSLFTIPEGFTILSPTPAGSTGIPSAN